MADSPSPSKSSSSPAISPSRQVPLSTPSIEISLVPPPLSPGTTRAHSSPNDNQIEKPKLRVRNPKEYSHSIVRSRSLGVRGGSRVKKTRTEAFYKCTLCYGTLPSTGKIFTLPDTHIDADSRKGEGNGRIFCKECWIWIYDLSICWTCGEVVGRLEERAPMKPPRWTGASSGIDLKEPPICTQCIGDLDKVDETGEESRGSPDGSDGILAKQAEALKSTASEVLHQMRRMNRIEESTGNIQEDRSLSKKRSRLEDKLDNKASAIDLKIPKKAKLEDTMTKKNNLVMRPTHVSLFGPLDAEESFQASKPRPLPKWMAQLPSNRVKESLLRRPSVPVQLPSQLMPLGDIELFDLPKIPESSHKALGKPAPSQEKPSAGSETVDAVDGSTLRTQRAQSYPERAIQSPRQASPFPFFQNPRAPLTPAVESSWGGTASPGMVPYSGLFPAQDKPISSAKSGLNSVLQSTEYKDKYSGQVEGPVVATEESCPICEEAIDQSTDDDGPEANSRTPKQEQDQMIVHGPNDNTYHTSCIQCRACRQPFRSKDSISNWTWVGAASPYHRTCMVHGAKPMLERLRNRLSMTALASRHQGRQEAAIQMLPGLTRPSPDPVQQRRYTPDFMTGVKKPDYIKNLPSIFSTRTGPEPCASCGHALLQTESVPGSNDTIHHVACLSACAQCGKDFGGKGTKWYVYGRRGLMQGICQECWVGEKRKQVVEGS
ncbi:hypothetical protein MMC30_005813 [Trapelia coarctata]|nr:hypothetical protein [Trapelia coarctata]